MNTILHFLCNLQKGSCPVQPFLPSLAYWAHLQNTKIMKHCEYGPCGCIYNTSFSLAYWAHSLLALSKSVCHWQTLSKLE